MESVNETGILLNHVLPGAKFYVEVAMQVSLKRSWEGFTVVDEEDDGAQASDFSVRMKEYSLKSVLEYATFCIRFS